MPETTAVASVMGRVGLAAAVFAVLGVAAGYTIWGWPKDWYRQPDLWRLPPGAQSDLVRYGWQLIVETPRHIGKSATETAKRYAGNDLACTHCHISAGLAPFAAPFISTFASFPMMVDDRLITLAQRINGCMTRSMNGSPLPQDSREMQALIAYIQFLGLGTPEGVRLPGMGLLSLPQPNKPPDPARGDVIYRQHCAACHGVKGEGELLARSVGYAIPPVWGPDSFNAAAGMSRLDMAAAFIRANMPPGANYRSPILTEEQAWDVAAFITAQPRPIRPVKID